MTHKRNIGFQMQFNVEDELIKEEEFSVSRNDLESDAEAWKSQSYRSKMSPGMRRQLDGIKAEDSSVKVTEVDPHGTNAKKSEKIKVKSSTAKYREKKKQELKELEESVRSLDSQLKTTDNSLREVKDKIMSKLQSNARLNNQINNQNNEIYAELQNIIKGHFGYIDEYSFVDVDKINLLLDTLKTRIGASGHQRQAKLNYHFKTIVNTIFPALYRYLLFTAQKDKDIFYEQQNSNTSDKQKRYCDWTAQILRKLNLSEEQKQQFFTFKQLLINVLINTKGDLARLDKIREILKEKELQIEKIEESIRSLIHPIESAKIILFCEKFKYKRELFFWGDYPSSFREQGEQRFEGRKRVKLDSSEDVQIKIEDEFLI